MSETKLPYNHEYTFTLNIGFSGAEREETVNPSRDSSYSEDEWNALSKDDQEDWLNSELEDWANSYIDAGWSK